MHPVTAEGRKQVALEVLVVHDPRRMIAAGLAVVLGAEQDISVAAVVTGTEALGTIPVGTTVVVTGDPDSLQFADLSGIRVCPFSTDDPLARIVAAVRDPGWEPREERATATPAPDPSSVRIGLSKREREIIRRLAEGLVPSQIGAELGITAKSVDNHKQRIFVKLGVQSQTLAVVRSRALGLLEPATTGTR